MAMLPKPELSLSLAGLAPDPGAPWAAGPRAAIEWCAKAGFRAIQLDAAAAGIRPRELDRSARRDIAAVLRRGQLVLSGLDLWIPPEHLTDPSRSGRAIEAIAQAVELSSELTRLGAGPAAVVSVVLPPTLSDEAKRGIANHAEQHGARIADHTLPAATTAPQPGSPIGIGLDPAALLLAGQDPAQTAARAGPALAAARLSDATMVGRAAWGQPGGRLDLTAYLAALAVGGYCRPLVLDLRGLHDQARAARDAITNWR